MTTMDRIKAEGLEAETIEKCKSMTYRGIVIYELTIDQLRFALLDTHNQSESWRKRSSEYLRDVI